MGDKRKEKVIDMRCPKCSENLKKVYVTVEGAAQKAVSYQCMSCEYVEFDPRSSAKVIQELKLKETPLKIRQKIVKLSGERLGFYFNQNIVRSLNLKSGEEVLVSVPDNKHIVINLKK